jgi:hypothetical protein
LHRFGSARWFLERYWSERHEQLEHDVEALLRARSLGISNGAVADALLDFLYCDGEFERVPNRSVAVLGRSALRFFSTGKLSSLQDCRERIDDVRALVGMKFALDVGATLNRWKHDAATSECLDRYEQHLQAISNYGSPVRHVVSGVEGYFLLARSFAAHFLELSELCGDASQGASSTRLYTLMASLAGIHMQSFVALEELLCSGEAVALEAGILEGKEGVLITRTQAEAMSAFHSQSRDRDNTRARVRVGCPAFAAAIPVAAKFHARIAVPLITGNL